MTDYQPNFNDPRVRRRCITALIFLDKYIWGKAKPVAQSQIIRNFGNPCLSLGGYLKNTLLICTNSHWDYKTGKCKLYVRNRRGVAALRKKLNAKDPVLCPIDKAELASGDFQYKSKSNRSWHPLQNRPNKIRTRLFADQGYVYEYDLENAAPTLLYQYAQRLVHQRTKGRNRPLHLPHIEYYLANKDAVRKDLAEYSKFTERQIKKTLTALFQGAKLIADSRCALYHELEQNYGKTQTLKLNSFVVNFRKEIRKMWSILNKAIKEGTQIKRVKTKHKSKLYRELEEKVMGIIWREMGRIKVKHFREHDGWRSRDFVDPNELEQAVRNELGFVIKIKWRKV